MSQTDPAPEQDAFSAAFDEVDRAQEAMQALQRAGIPRERMALHHGAGDQDFGQGRTGTQDDEVAGRMVATGLGGAVAGTVVGLLVGALVASLFVELRTAPWWGATLGTGLAGGGVGVLWGFMGGFTGRSRRTRGSDRQSEHRDPEQAVVTVHAETTEQRETSVEVLETFGGEPASPRYPG